MQTNCEYVRQMYGVPARIGVRVIVSGKPGIIAEDRGHYIGVNFDVDKPGVVHNAHPTSNVIYGEMGTIRKMTRSQARYQKFLDCEHNESFSEYIREGMYRVHEKGGVYA